MNFCTRLENLLEESNLTQKQLAQEFHVANSTINGYVRAYREPDFAMLIRLARYFHVTTDYLLGLSEEKKPAPSSLNPAEARLVNVYRSLSAHRQELLTEQALIYQRMPDKL